MADKNKSYEALAEAGPLVNQAVRELIPCIGDIRIGKLVEELNEMRNKLESVQHELFGEIARESLEDHSSPT